MSFLFEPLSSNIYQEVNLRIITTHERLDRVQDVITIFLKKIKALNHSECPEKYLWPRYLADLLKMESQKRFMGSEVRYTNTGTLSQRRLHSVDAQLYVADRISIVEAEIMYLNLEALQWFIKRGFWWRYKISNLKLYGNLWFEVFSGEDISEMNFHGRSQNNFKCKEKHHWKRCDCRRWRFD